MLLAWPDVTLPWVLDVGKWIGGVLNRFLGGRALTLKVQYAADMQWFSEQEVPRAWLLAFRISVQDVTIRRLENIHSRIIMSCL